MKQQGFTLVEVLVALSIVGLITAFLSPVFIAQSKYNTTSELKSLAINATDRQVDLMRLTDPATMQSSGSTTSTVTAGGKNFSVKIDYCVTSSYCSSVTRHLKFTTSYRGIPYHATETVFTQLR